MRDPCGQHQAGVIGGFIAFEDAAGIGTSKVKRTCKTGSVTQQATSRCELAKFVNRGQHMTERQFAGMVERGLWPRVACSRLVGGCSCLLYPRKQTHDGSHAIVAMCQTATCRSTRDKISRALR